MVAIVAVSVAVAGDAANNTADATNDTANCPAYPTNDATNSANDATNCAPNTSNHTTNASNNTGDWRAAGATCTRGPAVAAIPARTIAIAASAASATDVDRTRAGRSRARRCPDSGVFAIRGAAIAGHRAATAREAVCDTVDVQPNLAQ
jgi:hypothetical protein